MPVTPADMMMARDEVARAWNAMKVAEATANAEVTEENCRAVAKWRREWKSAVMRRETMERRMWREQDAAEKQAA